MRKHAYEYTLYEYLRKSGYRNWQIICPLLSQDSAFIMGAEGGWRIQVSRAIEQGLELRTDVLNDFNSHLSFVDFAWFNHRKSGLEYKTWLLYERYQKGELGGEKVYTAVDFDSGGSFWMSKERVRGLY